MVWKISIFWACFLLPTIGFYNDNFSVKKQISIFFQDQKILIFDALGNSAFDIKRGNSGFETIGSWKWGEVSVRAS